MYERDMHVRGMRERGVQEQGVAVLPVRDRRTPERRRVLRRRASGPRPVRPAVSAVAVRPAEAERPLVLSGVSSGVRRVSWSVPGVRTLARRSLAVPRAAALLARVRRVLAGLAVTVAAGAVVVGLGMLADSTSAVRAGEELVHAPQGPVVVTVVVERTPWDVARRLAPGAQGPELADLAEQIVTDNSLGSVPLHPGQVLRVTSG
jgi:hypothetical protein